MGVQGLKSYIESNSKLFRKSNFQNDKLIIDGSNLYYILYFNSELDQMHGGDYGAFESLILDFFSALKACNIQPIVLLDGGCDHSDKKRDTLVLRTRDKIKRAHALSKGRRGNALPCLIKKVFIQVLIKLEVQYIQCVAEADWDIAALANQWNCPVLSDDSDFYIFALKAGFLPLSHFKWQRRQSSSKFIPAKQYRVERLCASFSNMNKTLLPVFATLAGNDFFKLHNIGLSLRWEDFSNSSGRFSRIDGLLRWLSRFSSPNTAIVEVLRRTQNKQDRDFVHNCLTKGIEEYQLRASTVAEYFSTGEVPSVLPGPLNNLPKWILKRITEGRLSSVVIDVPVLQRIILPSQVEDFEQASSNEIARPIRQVLYGLLLCGQPRGPHTGPGQAAPPGHAVKLYVEEVDRAGLQLSSTRIKAIQPASGGLHLKTLNRAPQQLRQQCLFETLGVFSTSVGSVPPHLHLPLYVTSYWWVHSHPKALPEHLWALLLGMVYGEICRAHRSTGEIGGVRERLNGLLTQGGRGGPDLHSAHTFSQWQSCLRDSINLNQLLCLPVPEPECAWVYHGTLVHQLVSDLRAGVSSSELLDGGSFPQQLFLDLKEAVLSLLDQGFPKALAAGSRGGLRASEEYTIQHQTLRGLSSRFELLMDEEEEDDINYSQEGRRSTVNASEEESISHALNIRSRHKKKKRACIPSKKQDRVCWD